MIYARKRTRSHPAIVYVGAVGVPTRARGSIFAASFLFSCTSATRRAHCSRRNAVIFQSTHPRGVRPRSFYQDSNHDYFNPRTRERCDTTSPIDLLVRPLWNAPNISSRFLLIIWPHSTTIIRHPYACFVKFFPFRKIFFMHYSIISSDICKYQNVNLFKNPNLLFFSKRSGSF